MRCQEASGGSQRRAREAEKKEIHKLLAGKRANSASFKAEWNQIWRWEDLRQEELRSRDLSSLTRDRTFTPCSGNKES